MAFAGGHMHLVYIDDSYERPYITVAAIAIPAAQWRDCFALVREWRHKLKITDGILINREFHATEFVAGRGRLGPKIITKHRRSQIFHSAFVLMNSIPSLRMFSACRSDNADWAFERLITRIHKTMEAWDSYALLICDEGKEVEYTRLSRKLAVFNPIRVGPYLNNVATKRILEDPFFKKSDRSYFIQLADFCSYGLLRREKRLASKDKYGIHKGFDCLANVVVREASPRDPMGVIR
jgi:hypothetical protein